MRHVPRSLVLLPVGLFGVVGVALAASWGDFKAAFPALPCQDGWAACVVDGQPVTPGMVLDGKGRPHAADMRIGFFEFDALPGLSPFEGLSAYKGGEVPTAGAASGGGPEPVAEASPEADLAATEREAARKAAEAAREAEQAEAAAAREAERTAAAEARARQEQQASQRAAEQAAREAASATDAAAKAAAQARAETARKAAAEAQARADEERKAAEAARKAQEAEAARKAQAEAARVAAEEQARKAQEAAAQADAARKAQEAETARRAAEAAALAAKTTVGGGDAVAMTATPPAATPAAGGTATCDNLVALEVPAMMGNLGAPVRTCLEGSLASASSQTTKDKISRVLIADAEARRDQGEWEKLMKRHLESIDRSDPNLCFKYALHLSRGGVGRAAGVIRWADYALENKQQWEGATYTKNVSGLYKVRAQAANRIWEDAEKKVVEDRSEENESKAERARGQTKDFAREWLDYARASGQDTAAALALCVSAAGNKEFCGG